MCYSLRATVLALALILLAALLCSSSARTAEESPAPPADDTPAQPPAEKPAAPANPRPSPRPDWHLGDWWITETHVLTNISERKGAANQLADKLFYHQWSVAGEQKVGETACWVVEIRAHNLPKEIVDDQKGDYLIRLYLNKDNFSLVKLERNTREREYRVTGERVNTNSQSFANGEAAIITSWPIMCPLDVPKLPGSWHEEGLAEREKEMPYTDEWCSERAMQRIQPFSTDIEGKSPAMLITLIREQWPIRTMLWLPDRPWWSEWRCQSADGKIENVWYSRMIDWKGKADPAAPPADGGATPPATEAPAPPSDSGKP